MTPMTFEIWMILNVLWIYNPRYRLVLDLPSFLESFLLVNMLAPRPVGVRGDDPPDLERPSCFWPLN